MRSLFVFVTLFLLSQASAWGQVVVGTYHLAATDKDYVILVDDMRSRFKGKTPNEQLNKCRIYMQVESSDDRIDAYIELSTWYAEKFCNKMIDRFDEAKRYSTGELTFRVDADEGEVDLVMKCHDDDSGNDIYGYESGQNYHCYYERHDGGKIFLEYFGDKAKSEGKDKLTLKGWHLYLSSEEEIQVICELIKKAKAMIKSNSLTPEL